jgi:hypothetical protein
VYSDVELFRSSPFFLAIQQVIVPPGYVFLSLASKLVLCEFMRCIVKQALDTSPGIPALGRWLGITDPTRKSEMFFKLHQLQVPARFSSTFLHVPALSSALVHFLLILTVK